MLVEESQICLELPEEHIEDGEEKGLKLFVRGEGLLDSSMKKLVFCHLFEKSAFAPHLSTNGTH